MVAKERKSPAPKPLLVILSLLFVLITLFVLSGLSNGIDTGVEAMAAQLRSPAIMSFFSILTFFGSWGFLLPASLLLVLLLLATRQLKNARFAASAIVIGTFATFVLKEVIQRTRPPAGIMESGFSFPSGHAAMAMIFLGIVIILAAKKLKDPTAKYVLIVLCLLLILLIGLSRIMLGVHWMTDVVAGWVLGAVVLVWLARAFSFFRAHQP
ncbi:phosphatase PAP2 family protein [Candidatus Woesearchaeota archaeon]|nr:phosphatase PAP2 family protein [Candidatus Woesearchaeota archaeon]